MQTADELETQDLDCFHVSLRRVVARLLLKTDRIVIDKQFWWNEPTALRRSAVSLINFQKELLFMRNKRAFLLFVVMIVLAVHGLSADDTNTSGKRILIKESGTLFLTDPDGLNRRKIAEKVSAGAFSPDGNLIAYADAKSVSVFSLLGGQTFTLGHVTEGGVASIAWSPDQKRLAYDVEVRMKRWDLFLASYPPSGDAPRNLGPWYETISFSADGEFIVHPSFGPQVPNLLETVNVESGKRETIYKAATTIWDAKYSPDGSSIAFMMTDPEDDESQNDSGGVVTDLWILPLDSKKPVRIMRGVFHFDWSPDGRFLAIETGTEVGDYPPDDGAIFISSVDGKIQFQLSKNAPSIGPVFSPDSKKVMFVDFNATRLVIGDLATRKLTPQAVSGPRGDEYGACDWK